MYYLACRHFLKIVEVENNYYSNAELWVHLFISGFFLVFGFFVVKQYKPENKRECVHLSGTSYAFIWVTKTY